MKRTRSLIALATFAFIFACVVSCEEDERFEKKSDLSLNNSGKNIDPPNKRVGVTEFNGTEGDPLDLTTAKRWTASFRKTLTEENEIQAHYFGTEIIQSILSQSECVGIRIYYALDDNGEKKLLLVGVDSSGENMLPSAGGKVNEGAPIGDFSFPCPDYCPSNGL